MKHVKKIAVILPVLVISCVYAYMNHLQRFQHISGKRLFALIASVVLFYVWVAAGIRKRRQHSFFDVLVQSSFYVYVFSVLTLTGYFVLFNQVSVHDWWHKMIQRVDTRDGVNLTAFVFIGKAIFPSANIECLCKRRLRQQPCYSPAQFRS